MDNNMRSGSKFTCFFCNNVIENDTETGHMAVCGKVLVPCPNKCGAYVARIGLKKHNKECVNRTNNTIPRQQKQQQNANYTSAKTNTNGLSNNELYLLSRRLADLESRFQFQQQQQNQLSASMQNYEKFKSTLFQSNLDLEKIKYQHQLSYDWQTKTDSALNNLKLNLSAMETDRKKLDNVLNGLQTRITFMEKLQDQINTLKDSFLREQAYNRQVDMDFVENVEEIKKQQAQDTAKSVAILGDVKDALEQTKQDLENSKIKLEDQGIKFTNIIYDLRGFNQNLTETVRKIEEIEKDSINMKQTITQLKLDMEIMENLTADFKPEPGRLLWRITEIDAKLVQAKQSGTIVKSPIFYTHNYGYRLRVLLYLNGLKKWKDRYALLCLQVLKGEYDMVLKWPCSIEGTITLKDLDDLDKIKPFSKTITAKRQTGNEECEEPQESSSCYIFIPHSILFKSNHVKNDTLFLDIKIRNNSKLETSL